MIAIIDYGAGNIRSVVNAINKLGYQSYVTTKPAGVQAAKAVILPGVGAAADTMSGLRKLGMIEPVRQFIAGGGHFFGVCIGLQILSSRTEEGGGHECLGIIPGVVKRLPPGLKIPHMGWNQVKQTASHPIFDGIPDEANFYFVHSYYFAPDDEKLIIGQTEYGMPFCSAITRGNLVATQFHPEKSGDLGLKIYDNFLKSALDNNGTGEAG